MKKILPLIIAIFCVLIFQLGSQKPVFGKEHIILFSFDNDIEEWVNYQGEVNRVSQPSADGDGSLEVSVSLIGRGWTQNTYESPIIEEDFSKYRELKVQIFLPSDAPYGIKAQFFTKSGSKFLWGDNGWKTLRKGEWTILTLPLSRIKYTDYIRTIGIQIGSNGKYNGIAYIDKVEAIPILKGQVKLSIDTVSESHPGTLNDYNEFNNIIRKSAPLNRWNGRFGTWDYNGGICRLANSDISDALKLEYRLPRRDTACGYFEFFGGKDKARPLDISRYKRFQFKTKSGSEKVKINIEFVEYDEYAPYNNGPSVIRGPFEVTPEWRGKSINLELLRKKYALDWTYMKQVAIKIEGRDNPGIKKGVLYFDDLEFLK